MFDGDPEGQAALRAATDEPTLWDAFVGLLRASGLPADSDAEIAQTLNIVHGDTGHAGLDALADALMEYDQLFALWRYRHS